MEKFIYQGKFIQVSEEEMNGAIWERAYIPNGVIIFPVTNEGKILLVKEKRPHETPAIRLKMMAGILEAGESPEITAVREMREEIGFRPSEMINFFNTGSSGTVNSKQYYFLAKGLIKDKIPNPDGEDVIISIESYSLDEIFQMYMEDKIKWANSSLGFFRLYYLVKAGELNLT